MIFKTYLPAIVTNICHCLPGMIIIVPSQYSGERIHIKQKRMFEICLRNPCYHKPKTTYAILEHYPDTHTKMKILVIFNEIFIKIVHSPLFYEGANNIGSYEIILKLYINSDRVKLNFENK